MLSMSAPVAAAAAAVLQVVIDPVFMVGTNKQVGRRGDLVVLS